MMYTISYKKTTNLGGALMSVGGRGRENDTPMSSLWWAWSEEAIHVKYRNQEVVVAVEHYASEISDRKLSSRKDR